MYAPAVGEDFARTVHHLNEAGLVVLLAVADQKEADEALSGYDFYYSGWQKEIGTAGNEIADCNKKISAFTAGDSVDREYK